MENHAAPPDGDTRRRSQSPTTMAAMTNRPADGTAHIQVDGPPGAVSEVDPESDGFSLPSSPIDADGWSVVG